jgi:hypothetical protein
VISLTATFLPAKVYNKPPLNSFLPALKFPPRASIIPLNGLLQQEKVIPGWSFQLCGLSRVKINAFAVMTITYDGKGIAGTITLEYRNSGFLLNNVIIFI